MRYASTILTGVLLLAVTMCPDAMAASFKAGDVDCSLTGSVRIETGYRITDYGDVPATYTQDDKKDYYLENPGTSRVGFGATYGKLTGYAEIGINDAAARNTVSTRLLYGEYDMGGGNKVTFGQTWSLFAHGFNWQRQYYDLSLQGFGNFYGNRNSQIRFTHAADTWNYKVALENSKIGTTDIARFTGALGAGTYQVEDTLPVLTASLSWMPNKNITITPSLVFQQASLKPTYVDARAKDVDVLTWGAALNGFFKTEFVSVNAEAWYGQNLGLYGYLLEMRPGKGILFATSPNPATTHFGCPAIDASGYDVEDVDAWGGFLELTFPISKQFLVNVGSGYQTSETGKKKAAGFEEDISTKGAYLNCMYYVTPQFSVTPEIAFFDYGKDATGGTDLGDDTFIGFFFQYDF